MTFDEFDKPKNQRINIATRLCQGFLAHHGHYGRLDEFVEDAYTLADEILKQGSSEFMNMESHGKDLGSPASIINKNYYNTYGDNVI